MTSYFSILRSTQTNLPAPAGSGLVVVGSHGRRGIEGLLLGIQAVKLLTHTKVPALVVR